MKEVRRFAGAWAVWAAGLFAFAAVAEALGGGGSGGWAYVLAGAAAMALACYPAGLAAAPDVVRWQGPWLAPLVTFGAATVVVALAIVALRGFVGPAFLADLPGEPATWSLGERMAALSAEVEAAERAGTLEAWARANRIGWHVDITLTSALGAIAFAWIGALLGAWMPRTLRREIRVAIFLAGGVFFLLTGYLMTENGYEQLLLRTVGPAQVVAWLPLIAPGMTAAALLVPTLARLIEGSGAGPEGAVARAPVE